MNKTNTLEDMIFEAISDLITEAPIDSLRSNWFRKQMQEINPQNPQDRLKAAEQLMKKLMSAIQGGTPEAFKEQGIFAGTTFDENNPFEPYLEAAKKYYDSITVKGRANNSYIKLRAAIDSMEKPSDEEKAKIVVATAKDELKSSGTKDEAGAKEIVQKSLAFAEMSKAASNEKVVDKITDIVGGDILLKDLNPYNLLKSRYPERAKALEDFLIILARTIKAEPSLQEVMTMADVGNSNKFIQKLKAEYQVDFSKLGASDEIAITAHRIFLEKTRQEDPKAAANLFEAITELGEDLPEVMKELVPQAIKKAEKEPEQPQPDAEAGEEKKPEPVPNEQINFDDIKAKYGETDLYKNSNEKEKPAILHFFYYYENPQQLEEREMAKRSSMRDLEGDIRKRVGIALATLKKKDQEHFNSVKGMLSSRDTEFYQALAKASEKMADPSAEKSAEKETPANIGKVTETLVASLDAFIGTPPKKRPHFFYPVDNLLKTQSKILQDFHHNIRVLLDKEKSEMDQELLAYNDENLEPGEEPKQEPQVEPAAETPTETPPSGKRDLYEAKAVDPKDVEVSNLEDLKDYLDETIQTLKEYKMIAQSGTRGSNALYSKYSSQLGQEAYQPKKVLYKINLPSIVNLANSFISRLEFEVRRAQPEEDEQLQEAEEKKSYTEIVKQIKSVFNFVANEGASLRNLIQQHENVDGLKNVRAIRKSGEAIYEQLSSIREHFPLVNPFETELYGSKGFDAAESAIEDMLRSVVNVTKQLSSFDRLQDVPNESKKRLLNVLEQIVSNIKDTFAGKFDERPPYNEETDPKEFEDKAPTSQPADETGGEEVADDPEKEKTGETDKSESPGSEENSEKLEQAMEEQNFEEKDKQAMRSVQEQLDDYFNFYTLSMEILSAFSDKGEIDPNSFQTLVNQLTAAQSGLVRKQSQVMKRVMIQQKAINTERGRVEDRTISKANSVGDMLRTKKDALMNWWLSIAPSIPQLEAKLSDLDVEAQESLRRIFNDLAEFVSEYSALQELLQTRKIAAFTYEKYKSGLPLMVKAARQVKIKAIALDKLITQNKDAIVKAFGDDEAKKSAEIDRERMADTGASGKAAARAKQRARDRLRTRSIRGEGIELESQLVEKLTPIIEQMLRR